MNKFFSTIDNKRMARVILFGTSGGQENLAFEDGVALVYAQEVLRNRPNVESVHVWLSNGKVRAFYR